MQLGKFQKVILIVGAVSAVLALLSGTVPTSIALLGSAVLLCFGIGRMVGKIRLNNYQRIILVVGAIGLACYAVKSKEEKEPSQNS